MSRARGAALVVALVAAMLAGVTAPALADTKYASKVTLASSFPAFHGKVKSKGGAACTEGRKVRLYSEELGGDELLGRTRSKTNGRWKIPVKVTSGVFYAKVTNGGSASLGVRCKGDVSKPVSID